MSTGLDWKVSYYVNPLSQEFSSPWYTGPTVLHGAENSNPGINPRKLLADSGMLGLSRAVDAILSREKTL